MKNSEGKELNETLFTKAFETKTQRSLRIALTQRLASPMYLVSSPSAILLHKTILS
ncbi:hypothetical protein [Leptospira noguchii]|uniref:Uncharacterized protein n=1 Tax=Leptospira noguchii serovar Autumnalis str. ZUN142 TaxID=1085540 RepID=M6UMA3_9LEPT|nr:hypothetical protein [Leptospira noguchii]EKR73908.1 hypothetical protein LEP1GSC041_0289 [Leptospira noguchii str. 2006001870]EMO42179.1 hypothetical protein LEP1GSC186_0323 [Leptospira noguchii serovar Autumnalis str. ZUN142]UOG47897.1 hypothetical protein MAL00_12615 [Leptospira noguchii]